jgi:hypothetical protein
MTDRQPYIAALMDACPGGGWAACGLSPIRIRSLAFERVDIMFGHDLAPRLTICRTTYSLPLDPEALALQVYAALQAQAVESERAAKMLRAMCFPMGG